MGSIYRKTSSALITNEQEEENTTGELEEKGKYTVSRFPSNPEFKKQKKGV